MTVANSVVLSCNFGNYLFPSPKDKIFTGLPEEKARKGTNYKQAENNQQKFF